MTWNSFVALGDSFTEGLDDPGPGDQYIGWADRVASKLAVDNPDFRYANLAIRGRCIGPIVEEQVPRAVELHPDLVSFAGGVNDALRPKFSIEDTCRQIEEAVSTLRSNGSDVLLFAFGDPSKRSTTLGTIRNRMRELREFTIGIGSDHGCYVVDLWPISMYDDPRVWSQDRLHLNAIGHERTAQAALEVLGLGNHDWAQPLPPALPTPAPERIREHLTWTGKHLAPWVGRRIKRKSSGDEIPPKRYDLLPVESNQQISGI